MRRFQRILVLIAITAALLEIALQFLAVAAYLLFSGGSEDRSAGHRVLCIGDSYTFGAGATTSEHSYPMALQRLLNGRGLPTRVYNAGWPGRDSSDVLGVLQDRIRESSPQVVCVLVGCNDEWNQPARREAGTADGSAGFQWRWRTARLVKLLLRGVGVLHDPASSGTAGATDAATVAVAEPSAVMLEVGRRLLRDAGIEPGAEHAIWSVPAEGPAGEPVRAAKAMCDRGDYAGAIPVLRAHLQAAPVDPFARRLLVEAFARTGARPEAASEVEPLRRLWQADPSLEHGEHLSAALVAIGATDEAIEVGNAGVARHPRAAGIWFSLGSAQLARDQQQAATAFRRLLSLTPAPGRWNASEAAGLGWCIRESDPENAARLVLAGLLLQGTMRDYPWSCYLQVARGGVAATTMRALGERDDLDDQGRELLRRAHAQVYGTEQARWLATLQVHLEAIEQLIRAAGARPVFVGYPFATQQEAVMSSVAAARGIPFVCVRERFAQELATRAREELFVADGHCNDAGYALLAATVAPIVADLLRQ